MDRKIARNQNKFEALDFNAAVGDSRMSPVSAFVATIRGEYLENWPADHGIQMSLHVFLCTLRPC